MLMSRRACCCSTGRVNAAPPSRNPHRSRGNRWLTSEPSTAWNAHIQVDQLVHQRRRLRGEVPDLDARLEPDRRPVVDQDRQVQVLRPLIQPGRRSTGRTRNMSCSTPRRCTPHAPCARAGYSMLLERPLQQPHRPQHPPQPVGVPGQVLPDPPVIAARQRRLLQRVVQLHPDVEGGEQHLHVDAQRVQRLDPRRRVGPVQHPRLVHVPRWPATSAPVRIAPRTGSTNPPRRTAATASAAGPHSAPAPPAGSPPRPRTARSAAGNAPPSDPGNPTSPEPPARGNRSP